jgi:hypothetical protein
MSEKITELGKKEILKPRHICYPADEYGIDYNPLFTPEEQKEYNSLPKNLILVGCRYYYSILTKEQYIEIGEQLIKEGLLDSLT